MWSTYQPIIRPWPPLSQHNHTVQGFIEPPLVQGELPLRQPYDVVVAFDMYVVSEYAGRRVLAFARFAEIRYRRTGAAFPSSSASS